MPEVRYIWVRLSESGAREVKAALEGVAAAADDVKTDIKIKVKVDDAEKVRLQIARLGDAGDRAGFQASIGMERYRRSLENLRKTLSDVNREADKLQGADSGGGGGGFFGRIFSGLAGVKVPLGPFGSLPAPVVGAAALVPGPAFLGIIPLLAAATLGVASFGALAYPTFQKVAQAVSGVNTHLSKLSPGMREVVLGIRGVEGTFTGLAKVLGPQVLPVIRDLLPGIRQLIGDMGPFAHAVAPVLDQLAKSFSRFTMSAGFKQFLDQMLKLSGPALLTIGQGLGHVAIAVGKLLEGLASPSSFAALRFVFRMLGDIAAAAGNLAHWIGIVGSAVLKYLGPHIAGLLGNLRGQFEIIVSWAEAVGHAFANVGHAAANLWRAIAGTWDLITGLIGAAGNFIDHVLTVNIPHAGAVLLTWFAALPGKAISALSSLASGLFGVGQAAIQGLWNGLQSLAGSILSWISGFASSIWSAAKGALGIRSPSVKFFQVGTDIMAGLADGMKRGSRNVFNVARDLGIQISDQLMDAFMSRNDRRSDAAGAQIAAILRSRLEEIRAYIVAIAQQEVAWASIVSAATGPAFSTPRWIGPHWVRGHPGTPGSYSHTGAPVGGTPGSRGHLVAGHWAGGNAPPTGAQLLRNLNLDLGRLRAFAHVMARLRRMGLDPVLWNQILAAGPDQGYQIAEAILDAGRGEIWQLNRAERGIYQAGVGLGRTGAKGFYGTGITAIFNFNGLIAGNPREIAREIWKLLRDLKRHNGGANLGLA